MASKILALLLLVGITSVFLYSTNHQNSSNKFAQWEVVNGKKYENEVERLYRQKVFEQNVATMEQHNADQTQTYKMGMNQFSDLTQSEFVTKYLTPRVSAASKNISIKSVPTAEGDIDWVAAGKVTPVEDQDSCDAHYAFSAVGAIESAFLIQEIPVSLSAQQVVDCSISFGNNGCYGGSLGNAYSYIISAGITSQSNYPFIGMKRECALQKGQYTISNYQNVSGCEDLASALKQQPISISADATNWSRYKSGVFSNCDNHNHNHYALLVGLTERYWRLKNQWGVTWGEAGYIRLARGNTCGICDDASYPTI